MFNLEKEIKKWRRNLYKYRGFEDGHVEELTDHLRDHVEESVKTGLSEEKAFSKACAEMGTGEDMNRDFRRAGISGGLLGNYFRIAWRSLVNNRIYSVINIAGLAVGFICLIIMGLQFRWEYSYDKHFKHSGRLYRVYDNQKRNGEVFSVATVMLPLGPAIEKEVPEIEKAVRISHNGALFKLGDKRFVESIYYADDKFVEVMGLELVKGTSDFSSSGSIVLSESFAKKYFGKTDPLGKVMYMNINTPLVVSGVIGDTPLNSHLSFNMLVSMKVYEKVKYNTLTNWNSTRNDYTYVLLKPESSVENVERSIAGVLKKNLSENGRKSHDMKLQKLTDIHFMPLGHDHSRSVPEKYIKIFGLVGILIMIIACINYVNLATARSSGRARESGMRKVLGAGKGQLMRQFLTESLFTSAGGFLLAVFMLGAIIPFLQRTFGMAISFSGMFEPDFLLYMILVVAGVGLLSGFYPAFIISSFSPVKNFREKKSGGTRLRGVLVTGQFAVSILLIIANIMVYRQVDFMKKRDPGFESDNIMVVRTGKDNVGRKIDAFRDTLMRSPYASGVTVSSGTPGSGSSSTSNYTPEGREKDVYMRDIRVDYDFMKIYGIKLLSGRWFSKKMGEDRSSTCIINEAAARKIGWEKPEGKFITAGGGGDKFRVIGVIKDFQYGSARKQIWPTIYTIGTGSFVTVRFRESNKSIIKDEIKRIYQSFNPEYPFSGYHVTVRMERFLRMENIIFKLLNISTIVALLISCLGIYGLISFTVEQKSKEIGIRKVLGAPSPTIFIQLLKGFGFWVVLANLVAFPSGYFLINQWLGNYAYKVDLPLWIFPLSSLFSLIIAIMAAGLKAWAAAGADPVKSLKYE